MRDISSLNVCDINNYRRQKSTVYTLEPVVKRRLLFLAILFFMLLSSFFICKTVAAKKSDCKLKTITSVQIEPGDSLWSIAVRYKTDECGSMTDYINEIKRTNHLEDDVIHAGNYIIVPYYIDRAEKIYTDASLEL